MKRNRVVLAILWILSLVGISFFGGPVSYGFFALFTFIPVISLIYLILVYFFFHIYQEPDKKHLTANHITPFHFILANEFHFGFVSVRVRFYSSFSTIIGLDDGVEYEFLPHTDIRMQTGLNCKYRGEYEIGIKTVELVDFFRLFRISYHNKEARRVVVKPDIVELTEIRSISLSQTSARDSRINRTERDVTVRKYEFGDDPRLVNWKATARSGELLVHKRIGEERVGIGILLGTHRISGDNMEYIPVENKMLETAIALTLFFAKKNTPVYSYHISGRLSEISVFGIDYFNAYYEQMSAVAFREDVTEEMLMGEAGSRPEIFRCKTVFMVLRDWSEEIYNLAKRLHENGVLTVVYLVRDVSEGMTVPVIPGVIIRCIPKNADIREVI
ncbi:MAG: DUF58 domain-containing protein [Eubacterium sp.]|nr:DUF58 domain-containing protein [Eubacterium sp.]